MKMKEFSPQELVHIANQIRASELEAVWDLSLFYDNKIVPFDYMLTSQLFQEDEVWIYKLQNPKGKPWTGEINSDEIKLYLPPDLKYSFESRMFEKSNSENGQSNWWSFKMLPIERWAAASFLCPFCSTLNHSALHCCRHLILDRGMINKQYTDELKKLKSYTFNKRRNIGPMDFVNHDINGIKIKFRRIPLPIDWIWQTTIYASDCEAAKLFQDYVTC